MDQFQRDFFLIRSAEYQTYTAGLGPGAVTQGDLTDPNYFDFISFAQYATISRDISDRPPQIFEEQIPEVDEETDTQRFVPRVVRRPDRLRDDKLLPIEHDRLVGAAVLDGLEGTFGETSSRLPTFEEGGRPSVIVLEGLMRQLVNLFLINGFAYDGGVTVVNSGKGIGGAGTGWEIKFVAPATLWSGRALRVRRAVVGNDFMLKVVKILMTRAGYGVKNAVVKYSKTEEITTFTLV